ncbi:MAG TPA: 2-oxoacid:acceptor oxidoreductase family protein [archaeon]|nr:2-oxoacid:acceptor oxidoreductase family protein [archaeon]
MPLNQFVTKIVKVENTLTFGFYGRSSQGVKTATRIFSKACFMSDFYVQSFVFTGGRGLKRGFVKIDKNPILSKQVEDPDFYLVFDPTLDMNAKSFKDSSIVLFNSPEKMVFTQLKKHKIKTYFVDATEIALTHMKANMPSTAMLGALAKLFNKISMKNIKAAMEDMQKENFAAFDEGYKNVR